MGWSSKLKSGFKSVLDPLDITGMKAGDAAEEAAQAQKNAAKKQMAYMTEAEQRALERSQPFVDLGTSNIAGLQALISPEGQMDYLQNNPILQAAQAKMAEQTAGQNAALGRFNSGATVNELFQNYLATGNQAIDAQYNRLLSPIQMGQNAALGQASNIMNTGTNMGNIAASIGDINAAESVAEANARQQGLSTLLQLGGLAMRGGFGMPGGATGATGSTPISTAVNPQSVPYDSSQFLGGGLTFGI